MPVSIEGLGRAVIFPDASRLNCMKTRFQISSQRSHSQAGPRHVPPDCSRAHGSSSPWWKCTSEQGPQGPVSPMAQKLSFSPRRRLVNSRVGSWAGTRGEERTTVCPCLRKYSRKLWRSSLPVMAIASLYRGSVGRCVPVGTHARERRERAHHKRRRVAAAHEVIAESRGCSLGPRPQQSRQPAAPGLEAALGLGRLLEGGG